MKENDQVDGRKAVLELVFILIVGLVVLGALLAALTYEFVSARAPLFVVIPLLLLVGIQCNSSRKKVAWHDVRSTVTQVLRGQNNDLNTIALFMLLLFALLGLIFLVGHYIGVALFMVTMFRLISRERILVSTMIAGGMTFLIYLLFEQVFRIELYRGMLYQLFAP